MDTSSGSLLEILDHKKTVRETFIYFPVALKITEPKKKFSQRFTPLKLCMKPIVLKG